jgi:hypothetical protein
VSFGSMPDLVFLGIDTDTGGADIVEEYRVVIRLRIGAAAGPFDDPFRGAAFADRIIGARN